MAAPRVGFNKKITGGTEGNPFSAPAMPVMDTPQKKPQYVQKPPGGMAKAGKPTMPGQGAHIPKGMKPVNQPMGLGQAFVGLLDMIGSAKSGTPMPKGSPQMIIGPAARPYIKDYQPGQLQAVTLKPKGGRK